MLLLLTIALVLVGAVALVIGFVNDAMFPIYLSIACSLAAAVVLVIFSRLSKARLEPASGAAISDEATGPVLIGRDTDFPIPDYEDRRVAEIVPLLADLDRDELEMVRELETAGRNRTTIVRRIDDLIAESDTEPLDDDEDDDALSGAAASFGREDDDEEGDVDEDLDDETAAGGDDLFPIADYDELSVAEILPLLDELTLDELEEVGDREADGQNRAAVLDRVDELLDEGEAAEAAAPKKAAPKKTTVKKAAAGKKATTKKAAAKKTTAKKAGATKATAKKAAPKKSPAKKAAAKKSGAKKSPAKKSPAKRAR
ncbi:MAG TPA: hypothetical protein VMY88_08330 [Acidimicrobiales bacterium]|nr:hypothetical protein [Acidimicrobiales bacterium]